MRRAPVTVTALAALLLVALSMLAGPVATAGSDPVDPGDAPPVTVNPFFPEERSLSECLSVVPRPGCGSEARGGPYQAAVFGAILLGLGVIGTRIVIGIRRNRPAPDEQPTS